jgi:hypothetical protein
MVISIYFDDHNPPHFHVLYNEDEALIAINDLTVELFPKPGWF